MSEPEHRGISIARIKVTVHWINIVRLCETENLSETVCRAKASEVKVGIHFRGPQIKADLERFLKNKKIKSKGTRQFISLLEYFFLL